MATEPVTIEVEVTGTETSEQRLRRLGGAVSDTAESATELNTRNIAVQQSLVNLGSTIGQVGAVLGRVNPALGRMGGTVGSIGAQIPALTGSLGPVAQAIAGLTIAVDLGSQAWDAWTGETERATRAVAEMKRQATATANSLTQLHNRQRQIAGAGEVAPLEERHRSLDDIAAGAIEERDRARTQFERNREQSLTRRRELERQLRQEIERNPANAGLIRRGSGAGREIAQIQAQTEREANRVRNLDERARAAERQAREAEENLSRARNRPDPGLLGELSEPSAGGGGGGGRTSTAERDLERGLARVAALRAQHEANLEALAVQSFNAELARQEELAEKERNNALEALEQIRRRNELAEEQHANAIRRLEEQKAQEREAAAQLQSTAEGVLGPAVNTITGAVGEMILGAKSAEDAFKGMLSSFLTMIAEQAALEAVKEYAAAIGSFAAYDMAGGALHLAAGVAWTGVAVAAGVGSAAVAPAAASAPASPQGGAGAPSGGGGGGTNVYNINGTIISSGGSTERARAGREIGALVSEGATRYGRTG